MFFDVFLTRTALKASKSFKWPLLYSASSITLHCPITSRNISLLSKDSSSSTSSKVDFETSVYVHWPYCKHICPYCNFNKYKSGKEDLNRLEDCYKRELLHLLSSSASSDVTSLYFGGGTPSLARPTLISSLISVIKSSKQIKDDAEVTLEVNPSTSQAESLRLFKEAGVTRVSIGVQSFDDVTLNLLGRDHTSETAKACISIAKEVFEGNVSFDLMFGCPGQTVESWQKELDTAVSMGTNHISLYHLTMERGTVMHKAHMAGHLTLPQQDEIAEMYKLARKFLHDTGLEQYEVANFSRKGYESEHNLSYWQGRPYIGIGPGAHGRLVLRKSMQREASIQIMSPNQWMAEVERTGHGTAKRSGLTQSQRIEELMLFGMRTIDGVRLKRLLDCGLDKSITQHLISSSRLKRYIDGGLLVIDENGFRASKEGLVVVDSMMPDVCLALEDFLTSSCKMSLKSFYF